jgi:hypothetical protein
MRQFALTATRRTTWLAVASATALLVGACDSDQAVGPRRMESQTPPQYSFTSAPGLPRLHSNKVKYRDHGKKHGTGRSGSARLSVRALYGPSAAGRPSETLLEITTGTFDDGSRPPGTLTKLQIRQFDGAGHVLSKIDDRKRASGGYAQYVLPNAIPGSTFQVTAHVKGIDRARTALVTAQEQVKRRPDLAASDLQAPARATPNAPVNISALVSELNGDVGARADCVLLVDGVEVDRARAIWVDASSSVNCAFTYAFTAEGTKRLTVAVQQVAPGDWDNDNNSVAGQITIGNLSDFFFEASAKEFEAQYRSNRRTHGQRFARSTGVLQWTHDQADVSQIDWVYHQYAEHLGWMPVELQFPLASLEMAHSTDGTSLVNLTRTNVEAQWGARFDDQDGGFRYSCTTDYEEGENVTHLYLEVCARLDYVIVNGTRYEFPETSFSHWRWTGEVTFLSRGFYERRFADGSTEGAPWLSNLRQQAGPTPRIPLGASYTMRFAVQGSEPGARPYSSVVVVPLDRVHVPWWVELGLSTESRWLRPESCIDFTADEDDFHDVWHVCEELEDYEAGRFGYVSSLPPLP